MLTSNEYEQLKTAIEVMQAVDLVNLGGEHVLRHNVLALVCRFAEKE